MLEKIKNLFFFKKLEYINGNDQILDLKLLSKLVGSKVYDYAISSDFTEIVCFSGKNQKNRFLKMRKYLYATNDGNIKQYAKRFIK